MAVAGAKAAAPADADIALTVYYDGACPLCSLEIGHYAGCAGAERLLFVDVSAPDADPGPGLSRQAALGRFHVRQVDGRILSGARAFAAIWGQLPRWRLAARIAALPGGAAVLELGYRAVLPVRPVLSRLASALGARPARRADKAR